MFVLFVSTVRPHFVTKHLKTVNFILKANKGINNSGNVVGTHQK